MLFTVTHIDAAGHRRKAVVTARSSGDAMDQMDRAFGDARGGSCVPMRSPPEFHLVRTDNRRPAMRVALTPLEVSR